MLQICIFGPWTTLQTQLGNLFVKIMWVTGAFTAQSSTRMYTQNRFIKTVIAQSANVQKRKQEKHLWEIQVWANIILHFCVRKQFQEDKLKTNQKIHTTSSEKIFIFYHYFLQKGFCSLPKKYLFLWKRFLNTPLNPTNKQINRFTFVLRGNKVL